MIFYNKDNNTYYLICGLKQARLFKSEFLKRINKKVKQMKQKTITRTRAVELMKTSQGRFFTVSFMKKDNTERTINGRTRVTKNSKGGTNPATNLGYISVYSTKEKGYRNVNSQTITSLKINGQTYNVR